MSVFSGVRRDRQSCALFSLPLLPLVFILSNMTLGYVMKERVFSTYTKISDRKGKTLLTKYHRTNSANQSTESNEVFKSNSLITFSASIFL